MHVKAVVVVSPAGANLEVTQLVLDDGGTTWVLGVDGEPRRSKRTYSSFEEAIIQNNRATTTAYEVAVDDEAAALRLLGRPPPEADLGLGGADAAS